MFAKSVIQSDAFLNMPQSTQNLYFHLGIEADDDGFIDSPRKTMRMIGASEDDFSLLKVKQFLIPFESDVVVVRHWKLHNYIRSDRYKPTQYQIEKSALSEEKSGAYSLCLSVGIPSGSGSPTACLPDGCITEQNRKEDNISSSPNGEVLKISDLFNKTYSIYPRKQGKAKGLASYRLYLTKGKDISGVKYRFNHQQLYVAIQQYAADCEGKDSQFVKHFDSFMNGTVIDYIEQTKGDYEVFMLEKYGEGWQVVKFQYA